MKEKGERGMPAIWNINQGYNTVNNKKLTSKLSFSQGEVFKGKIAEKTGEGEIKVKLSDGWQFSAEVEGDATFSEQDMVKFEVVGYENGKLKLKLLGSSEENVEVPRDTLKKLAQSEGLEENDVDILKKMVEYFKFLMYNLICIWVIHVPLAQLDRATPF